MDELIEPPPSRFGAPHGPEAPPVLAARALAELMWPSRRLLGGRGRDEQEKLSLMKDLLRSNIDPEIFDTLVARELDRRLKHRFGFAFLALTFLFTAVAYGIVAAHGACGWQLPDAAVVALIVETPVQFVGLLYIIARNLFPGAPARGAGKQVPGEQDGPPSQRAA